MPAQLAPDTHAPRSSVPRVGDLTELFEQPCMGASAMIAGDPGFFTELAANQAPEYLWIGCSDSRVPANQIVDLDPGDVFVHRNVANVVVHTDLNCLSVLQYALDVLGVKDVVVCGHYGCGGVAAALAGARHGLIDNWLRHVMDVAEKHEAELLSLPEERRLWRPDPERLAVRFERFADAA
jgi:carbonic anhydrase